MSTTELDLLDKQSTKADTRAVTRDIFIEQRSKLVRDFIKPLGLGEKIYQSFLEVPRHEFVPEDYKSSAYADNALPIGEGQTISQPSLIALMTGLLDLKGHERVLEVGTGSGYQAAILSKLAKEVHTVERIPELANRAKQVLKKLKINNVKVFTSNGIMGLPKLAPFDAIIVTAGAQEIPLVLVNQLKEGGTMVIPVGKQLESQKLLVGMKLNQKLITREVEDVRFVPLIN